MRKLFYLLLVLALVGGGAAYWVLLMNNVNPANAHPYINIPTGAQMSDVTRILEERGILKSMQTFQLTAQLKGYKTVKPGHYVFTKTMSNREIVNMLESGHQVPVKLVIYNIRTKEELAGLIGRTLEIDSVAYLAKLNDPDFCAGYHLDTNQIIALFIADSYSMKWNTNMIDFTNKMKGYYDKFWTNERRDTAKQLGYTPAEVTTLASIVEKECTFDKELPTVAGVYLNRLRIDMPLQADPTLKFATRDFGAKRVTDYHKKFSSPYNTYQHAGIPPGPICIPNKKSIEAVLNPESHDYIYFCANPDMSGYQVFSRTLAEQNKIVAEYHKKLDQKKILK